MEPATLDVARAILKRTVGHDRFRPGRIDIVAALLACKNVHALMRTSSGRSLFYISSSRPLLVAFGGLLISKGIPRPLGVAGLIGGMAGVILIVGTRPTHRVARIGIALCGIGALALTFATLVVKGASSGGFVMVVVGFQMLIVSLVLRARALVLEAWGVNWSVTVVAALLYTLFLPGLPATMVWFWLVRRIGPTRTARFHLPNPFLGVVPRRQLWVRPSAFTTSSASWSSRWPSRGASPQVGDNEMMAPRQHAARVHDTGCKTRASSHSSNDVHCLATEPHEGLGGSSRPGSDRAHDAECVSSNLIPRCSTSRPPQCLFRYSATSRR